MARYLTNKALRCYLVCLDISSALPIDGPMFLRLVPTEFSWFEMVRARLSGFRCSARSSSIQVSLEKRHYLLDHPFRLEGALR